jgi:hypothetical protein
MTLALKSIFESLLNDFSSLVIVAVERGSMAMAIERTSIFHVLILALMLGLLTAAIANHKGGSPFKWFLAGAFLGILVLPIAVLKKKNVARPARKQCPNCAGQIPIDALVCDACDYNFLSMMVGYRHRQAQLPSEHLA